MRGTLSSAANVPAAIAFLSSGYDKDKTARYTDLHMEVCLWTPREAAKTQSCLDVKTEPLPSLKD
jgi:hypothetical protein